MDWQVFLTSSDPNQRTLSPPLSLIPVIFWTHWPSGLYSYEISTQPAYEFLSVNCLYISYGILSPWRELGWSEGGWYKTTKKVSEIFPMSFLQDYCSTDSAFFLTVTFILTKMNGLCDLLPLTPTSYRSDLSRTMSGIVTLAGYCSVWYPSDKFTKDALGFISITRHGIFLK